jgi:aspartate racemase
MSKHIGIVGCSAEGAALCYRTICKEGTSLLGKHAHPEVTMHTFPLSEYMRYIELGDWEGVADLMLSSVSKLAKVGADFAMCPDNTIHQAFDLVVKESRIPWLHIAQEVANEAKQKDYKRLGILGTRYLMEGSVYPAKTTAVGIEYMIPDAKDRERMNKVIFDELVNAFFTKEALIYFKGVIDELKRKGCDAVVLGCTEIPLLVNQENSSLPVLDSTRILARAALKEATR